MMFIGCYLINAAAHEHPDTLAPVLGLVGVFNLYELAVLALGLGLMRRGTYPQGRQLLALAILLLADSTFIYNELTIAHPGLGSAVAAVGAALALLKLAVICRAVRLTLPPIVWALTGLGVALSFGAPVLSRVFSTGRGLPDELLLGLWWGLAVLLSGSLITAGQQLKGRMGQLILTVIAVSATAHILSLHWVYHESVAPFHLAPLLLGVSVALLVQCPHDAKRLFAGVFGVAALLAAQSHLQWELTTGSNPLRLSPLRLLTITATLAYLWLWWQQRTPGLLAAWPLLAAMTLLGPSFETLRHRVSWLLEQLWIALGWLTPNTLMHWGILLIGGAFAALGLGAWKTFRSGNIPLRGLKDGAKN